MKASISHFDIDQRRASARRTAWIAAGAAFVVFVLFFVQAAWHR